MRVKARRSPTRAEASKPPTRDAPQLENGTRRSSPRGDAPATKHQRYIETNDEHRRPQRRSRRRHGYEKLIPPGGPHAPHSARTRQRVHAQDTTTRPLEISPHHHHRCSLRSNTRRRTRTGGGGRRPGDQPREPFCWCAKTERGRHGAVVHHGGERERVPAGIDLLAFYECWKQHVRPGVRVPPGGQRERSPQPQQRRPGRDPDEEWDQLLRPPWPA